ncbi:MAG: AIM24 family protein [Nocardioidaceae bacterium]|nr:AIM24 family protein [Nocardioidaceae bacterium]MCL2613925.1 AIM24 family protein [Nocardioidaceae bacterium]
MTAANWHPDPTGRNELRYWDGSQWTEHVSNQGNVTADPLHAPAPAEQSTPAGQTARWSGGYAATEAAPRGDVAGQPAASEAAGQPAGQPAGKPVDVPGDGASEAGGQPSSYTPAAQPAATPAASQDVFAGIGGDLVAGRFSELTGQGPTLQNPRLLRVRADQPFLARNGATVAHQGSVEFAQQGGGPASFLKKTLTGEGLSLMRVEGQGEVFLADGARNLHLLDLQGGRLSVNGANVLAFSASLEWSIERIKGGSIAAGGVFDTTLSGTGWVAVVTDGDPVVLNTQDAPTYVDANALVAWSAHLEASGSGSGDGFQVSFQGPGFVIVQPSDGSAVPPHTH